MSIFSKKPESTSAASTASSSKRSPASHSKAGPGTAPAATSVRSHLGAGCELTGSFTGGGSLECSGVLDGTIEVSGDLVIGHGGTAKAQLMARRISIEGRLHGDATATEKIEVGASGRVEGDVRAPAVQFAEGAFFEGNVEMRRSKETESTANEGRAADGGGAAAEPPEGEDAG